MQTKISQPYQMMARYPMLSIDFGNSYTKVAMRSDRNEATKPYSEPNSLRYDDDSICIPTLAARVTDATGQERWHFGTQVATLKDSPRVRVFRNWKPKLFKGVETHLKDEDPPPSSDAAPQTAWRSLTNEQLEDLLATGLLNPSGVAQVTKLLKDRRTTVAPNAEEADFESIAVGYFSWLRTFVGQECQARSLGSVEEIPVRIMLPSFGVHRDNARMRLVELLKRAGWSPDEVHPALPEPIANIFGIVTEGRNKTWFPPGSFGRSECPTYAGMFPDSALYRALRKKALGNTSGGKSIYWAMVMDLGGYTTDFAMIGFDLDDIEERIEGVYQGKPRKADFSEPLGVYDLDKRVCAILTPTNQAGFNQVVSEVDTSRVDRLHQQVYQDSRPYDTGQGIIGKTTKERASINACVEQFAREVADLARRFRLRYQYDRIDELILTGGGFNIPKVRDAVSKELAPYLLGCSHIPADEGMALPQKCSRLKRVLVRGATAIGGASVIFDFPNAIG